MDDARPSSGLVALPGTARYSSPLGSDSSHIVLPPPHTCVAPKTSSSSVSSHGHGTSHDHHDHDHHNHSHSHSHGPDHTFDHSHSPHSHAHSHIHTHVHGHSHAHGHSRPHDLSGLPHTHRIPPPSSDDDERPPVVTTTISADFDCDRRRPEEESTQRRLTMSSQLMSKTVTPFLKDHIPGVYSPMAKRNTIESLQRQNADPNSRYCYRHRPDSKCHRAADEVKMAKIQSELENLKPDDQQAITHVWSLFSAAPAKHRDLMLQGIMTQCCFPQLSRVSREVSDQLKIDFVTALPPEDKSSVGYKILCYLDPVSLCKAAVVSKQWRELADDDQVWLRMCEQHIDRKCTKCGFGLPLLERKRLRDWTRRQQLSQGTRDKSARPRIPALPPTLPPPNSLRDLGLLKREASSEAYEAPQMKRACTNPVSESSGQGSESPQRATELERRSRPWKAVYRDRFRVGYNWRNGRCAMKIFRGHTNGVTCLQIDDNMMATGSYDATIRIWNLETGEQTRVLRGHRQGIRALQFDDHILVSGSLDGTMKIWNWRTGELLNTLMCHSGGVYSVSLDGEWLASGSADKTIKVFNLMTKESFSLKGHADWVNQVRIDGTAARTLFSASDDCTVKLWDLETKQCIRTFEGHVGHVQQVLALPADFEPDDNPADTLKDRADSGSVTSGRGTSPLRGGRVPSPQPVVDEYNRAAYGLGFLNDADRPLPPRYILSAALDSTIKCWDTATGRCVRTFFGHLEGVWALDGDTLRVVSGANDTMVKVWEPRSGKCERTWTGHRGPVTCVGLSDSRMASGSEDGEVRLYSFQDRSGLEEYGTPS